MSFHTLLKRFVLFTVLVAGATCALVAQTNSTGLPPLTGIATDNNTAWQLGIAVVTPFIVAGMKWILPRMPSLVIPPSTAAIGFLLGMILQWTNAAHLGWVDMTQAGAAAVMLQQTWSHLADATSAKSQGKEVPMTKPPAP